VALGGPASKLLLKTELGITSLRGQWGAYDDGSKKVAIMPTFHPAYLLRNPTLEVRGQIWTDLQEVMKALGLPAPGEKQAS
jgi:DNA polymerase